MVKIELNNQIVQKYWKYINDVNGKFKRPIEELKAWKLSGTYSGGLPFTSDEAELLDYSIDHFESIITANPKEIRLLIDKLSVSKTYSKKFKEEFQKRMRYEQFRDSKGAREHFRRLGIKACPYCNAQYTISIGKTGKALCHFDHVYPKSDYPFLALSIYNLIPCCNYCNQAKSNDDPLHKNFIHPFEDSISNKFKFILSCHNQVCYVVSMEFVSK